MKILHCADLHLDSKMTSNLDREKARQRKNELLYTFEKMIEYAADCDIKVILISGDMFDRSSISATARNAVISAIVNHSDIHFYYLKGNHDQDNFLASMDDIPANIFLFDEQWKCYEEGNICIYGLELNANNASGAYMSLNADPNRFNIVMLHGQESESVARDKAEVIDLKSLRNKNLDYLALGHVHARKLEDLDRRAKYCYPGCLEGRGFDECGKHGFVVIDVEEDTGKYTCEFVDFAFRELYRIPVDVSQCMTSSEMIQKIDAKIDEIDCCDRSLIRVELVGEVDVECEKDMEYISSHYANRFYFVKVEDHTKLSMNQQNYLLDESLKGEFVRMVMQDESICEEDKTTIIRYGMQVLAGEEVQ